MCLVRPKNPPVEKSLGNLRPHSQTNCRNVPCLGLRTCVFFWAVIASTPGTRRCSGNGHLTSRGRHACAVGSLTPRASRSPRRTSAGCPSPGPGRGRATSSATTTSRPPAQGVGPILETSPTTNPVRRWGNRISNWSPSKKVWTEIVRLCQQLEMVSPSSSPKHAAQHTHWANAFSEGSAEGSGRGLPQGRMVTRGFGAGENGEMSRG